VLIIFALLAGEQTYGLVGALFAVPVASIVQTLFLFFRKRWQTTARAPARTA
jgi:predicted PurR-regulated permease PerM